MIGDIRTPVPSIYGDWTQRFGETWKSQIAQLKKDFGKSIEKTLFPGKDATDVPIVYVKKDQVLDVLKFLKKERGFEYGMLADLTVVDEMPRKPRFDVVYNLYSMKKTWRIRIKVKTDGEEFPSVIRVWPGANWAEREAWDMFGIKFTGHPDLRRILMDIRWKGHPLRKDYPLRGYQLFPTPEPIDPKLLE